MASTSTKCPTTERPPAAASVLYLLQPRHEEQLLRRGVCGRRRSGDRRASDGQGAACGVTSRKAHIALPSSRPAIRRAEEVDGARVRLSAVVSPRTWDRSDRPPCSVLTGVLWVPCARRVSDPVVAPCKLPSRSSCACSVFAWW